MFDRAQPTGAHTSTALSGSVTPVTVPSGASAIIVQATGQNARFTIGGTNPTSSTGFQLRAGDPPILISALGVTLKFIQEVAGSTIEYQFIG